MRKVMVAVVAGMVLAGAAGAQDADEGEALFVRHCASCHGIEARGDGPMAPVLLVQPKNLRELAAENGGEFPVERVVMRIDGRDPLVSHGSDMPVFGPFFDRVFNKAVKTPAGQPILTSAPVADLVAYLQSIQHGEL